ncbi:MAG: ABC transporter permease [Dehalococcoidia bacterium]
MFRISTGRPHPLWLVFRWSRRDLRSRWLQVVAISLVIGLGTGSYAGLSSVTRWRRISTDDAYQALNMYDLRVKLPDGGVAPQGTLLAAVQASGVLDISNAEERLILDIQVDASTEAKSILVPGILYGVSVGTGQPAIAGLYAAEGRTLEAGDAGQPVAMLERSFSKYYDLPPRGTFRIAGGTELAYVGQALTPEMFIVTSERGGLLSEANYAGVFTSLETAQQLSGRSGEVNDLVLTLAHANSRESAATALESALDESYPQLGATVTTREEDPAYRLNNADIDGDQQVYDIFAFLMFAGAVVAAFNLIARLVEAQRREIGLSMVLGVRPRRIALRPMLVAAEIALLGVVFGVVVGLIIGGLMASVLRDLQPLPHWDTGFQPGVFASVAVAGFIVPFVATAWPVWRAVSVPPIRAIQSGYRAARGGGLAPRLRWLRVPGDTFTRMPFRNLLRAPRRALLTIIGIAAALAALVAFTGLIDSFDAAIGRGNTELLSRNRDRIEVMLDRFYPVAGPEVANIIGGSTVAASEPHIRFGGTVLSGDEEVAVQVELLPLDSELWKPTLSSGDLDRSTPGIYLAELAGRNLGVGVGDTVTLEHPRVNTDGTVTQMTTEVRVLGLHPHPYRFVAYMDINQAEVFGMAGLTNLVVVKPSADVSRDAVKRELFGMAGVASVQGVSEVAEVLDKLLSSFVVVLRVIEGAMLFLALLIAFNSASINMDERFREHATMFAFGVPLTKVVRMAVVENLLLGIVATAAGITGGWFLLRLIIAIRIPETLPDIDIPPALSTTTIVTTLVLGVIAVGVSPLLIVRRLRRMDIPSALKVFE